MKLSIELPFNQKTIDCSIFYKDGKLNPWNTLPAWYVNFLTTSYPNNEIKNGAKKELKRRKTNVQS